MGRKESNGDDESNPARTACDANIRADAAPRDSDQVAAYLDRLPRGRHKLEREQVEQSQRGRLIAALVELSALHGYDSVSILDVVSRAGTSKRTFYDYFADKEDCLVQAFDDEAELLLERTLLRIAPIPDPRERIVTGVRAYVDAVVSRPDHARLFITQAMSSGPRLADRWIDSIEAFAEAITVRRRLSREAEPELPVITPLRAKLVAVGLNQLLAMIVYRHGHEAVAEQGDELAGIVLTMLTAESAELSPAD